MAEVIIFEDIVEDVEPDESHYPDGVRFITGACGLMELVIHHLLRIKNIYPRDAFSPTLIKGVPFWFCDQPPIIKYVTEFLHYANKCLVQLKELEIAFILCRRTYKEVLEETYFTLKMSDLWDESNPEIVYQLDNLISICEDIQKTNTFRGGNTVVSGLFEIFFELIFLSDMDTDLPENDSDIRWVRVPVSTSEGNNSKKVYNFISKGNHTQNNFPSEGNYPKMIIPLRNQHCKKYEIAARVVKKA